jgi:anti-sigma B factor antagonist
MCPIHEDVQIQVTGTVALVQPTGELDMATAPALRTALEAAANLSVERLVVTLRDVSFLDSTGLGALVHGWRLASEKGVTLTVREPSPTVRRILDITGLDHLLDDG